MVEEFYDKIKSQFEWAFSLALHSDIKSLQKEIYVAPDFTDIDEHWEIHLNEKTAIVGKEKMILNQSIERIIGRMFLTTGPMSIVPSFYFVAENVVREDKTYIAFTYDLDKVKFILKQNDLLEASKEHNKNLVPTAIFNGLCNVELEAKARKKAAEIAPIILALGHNWDPAKIEKATYSAMCRDSYKDTMSVEDLAMFINKFGEKF